MTELGLYVTSLEAGVGRELGYWDRSVMDVA